MLILLSISILILILAACDFGMYDTPDKEEFRIGYDGLEYSFVDFPETEIYEDNNFVVSVDIHNKGAYNAAESKLVLGATPPLMFKDSTPMRKLTDIAGRSSYNPQGGYAPAPEFFSFEAGKIFATEELEVDIPLNLCYSYETTADLIGCIGAQIGAFTCEFEKANQKLNLSEGQGAPLAVTDVEEIITNMPGDDVTITFIITIENKGDGQVFKYEEYDGISTVDLVCGPGGYRRGTLNSFDYSVQLSKEYIYDSKTDTGSQMKCQGKTHLEENQAKIKCEIVTFRKPATRSPMKINLKYAYKVGETKQITIKKIVVDKS